MYRSDWRSQLTSDDLCDQLEGDCTGTVFDGAAPCGLAVLLGGLWPALLLILVF